MVVALRRRLANSALHPTGRRRHDSREIQQLVSRIVCYHPAINLFDGVFVLEVDLDTLNRRLDERPDSEWGGGKPTERELIARLRQTKEDVPKNGISIDATAPVARVVDEIVRQSEADK